MSQLALDLLQPLQPALDNFVPGRNAEALDVLHRLAQQPQFERAPARIVFLWGEVGCGRSHLLAAMAAAAGGHPWSATQPPDRPGLALVDDVERLDDAAQVSLFNRLNAVQHRADAACLVAGASPPARLALREDLRTRLAWGLVYQLHPLSDDEKAAALRAHAGVTGLALPDDVIGYLMNHLPRDMRTLVAAVDALDAYALARQRPLTTALLREWLQLPPDDPAAPPSA